jgi:para-nitrobenzyl esterase
MEVSEVVETTHGRLAGGKEAGLEIFRGIPFAAPPVGALRFRRPRPAAPWAGVRDATAFGASAPQLPVPFDLIPGLGVGETDEDCLTLNVYTPACDGQKRPVLVWIHGGAFTIGSGSQMMYDPRPLARAGDVVVVTVNYRLGALGFLHPGAEADAEASANLGLLDQIAALEFVRDNAEIFGGDPARVTIFGESAGGMSVGDLLAAPAANGLFGRAIPMSGAASANNDPEAGRRVRGDLCRALGIADGPGSTAALREIPTDALLRAQGELDLRYRSAQLRIGFRPGEDHDLAAPLFPETPLAGIAGGNARNVDVLVGTTRDEWRLFGFMDPGAAQLDLPALEARMETRAPGHGANLVATYRAARPDASPTDLFFALETDRIFRIPAIRLAEAQARHARTCRTWAYLFTWESPMLGGQLGACHGIDVPFAFGLIGTEGAEKFAGSGDAAAALGQATVGAWLGFARDGDPNASGLPDWPRYEPTRRATMTLGAACAIHDDPAGTERAAWEGVL